MEQGDAGLDGAVILPEITFRGMRFEEQHLDLNEACLSALAICMFLAGVRLSDNDYDNPAHPRFLFLDDALIGLDLQNRLPILRILGREEFKHFQVFLLTHDRV
jgi:wobble nucleotide-excising tRNase